MNKARLIKHIKNKGKQQITLTPGIIYYWWNVFNKVLFNNELRYPDKIVLIEPKEKLAGWVIYDPDEKKDKLTYGVCLDEMGPTRRWFYTIQVHEMAHVYTDMHHPNLEHFHGKSFMKWKDAVNELGLPFGREYKVTDFDDWIISEVDV